MAVYDAAGDVSLTRRSVIQLTGAAVALPAAPTQSNSLEHWRMAFTPKFVDLVCNYTTTVGTGDFLLGSAVNGYASFNVALQVGDSFYYSAIGINKPAEHEVGRGTLQANGTITRDPVSGTKTNFTSGTKMISLVAAAEWFNTLQSGGGSSSSVFAASRAQLAAITQRQSPVMLYEPGRYGLFVFDGSDLSAKVAPDAYQGVYVAPSSDVTGASGAWVRQGIDGPINAAWFGVEDGAPDNAARIESIEALFWPYARRILIPNSATGSITFERGVTFNRPHALQGGGQGIEDSGTQGNGPTVLLFPFGCGKAICWRNGPGGAAPGNSGAFRGSLRDLRIEFTGAVPAGGTASYNPISPNTINVVSGAGNFSNGQVVALEGAGHSLTVEDRTASITAGSNVAAISDPIGTGSNPGVYVGQWIDIAGAGLPAGTTVTSWNPTSITLSNNATATVTDAAYTITFPAIAEIVSGGGTPVLTVTTPWQAQAVTGGVLRHMDCGIHANCTIDVHNVEVNAEGSGGILSPGGGCGVLLYGVAGEGTNADSSQFHNVKTGGNQSFAGVICYGNDAQACSFVGCNFAGPKVSFLDMSFLGSDIVGCHFAFNVGIAVTKQTANTKLIGGYFEAGTSYIAPAGFVGSFYGTTSLKNASGWNGVDFSTGGLALPAFTCGRITASEDVLAGRSIRTSGGGVGRFVGTGMYYPLGTTGVTGVSVYQNSGRDSGVVQAEDGGANKVLELVGASIDIRPDNATAATVDASGIGLSPGKVLKIDGTQVVGAQQTGTPPDATDLATAITLVNALKGKLLAHGLIA